MTNNILSDLNPQQLEAVTTTEGYVRVLAGAGSGKTKALTQRYAYLVETAGINPGSIMCVTFTNKAASEMKKRIRNLIGDLDLAYITTFHGFGHRFLKEESHLIHYPKNFIILDDLDTETIIKNAMEELGYTSKDITVQKAKDYIGSEKQRWVYINLLIDSTLENLLKYRKDATSVETKIFGEYLYAQRKTYGFDYHDLIQFPLFILNNNETTCKKWQQRLEYVMVDEFQDVSDNEYCLVKILSDYHKNLFVVGDPDQTIYSWRGAKVNIILDFDKVFPSTKTILMNQNYRSLQRVISAANSLIDKNKKRIKKDLTPVQEGTGHAIYFHAKSQQEEADWIAKQILSLNEQGVGLSNIAVLYRAHYVSRSIEEAFLKNKIPYTLFSGVPFYSRKEIKDVLSYLRLISSDDDLSFNRVVNVPSRGIGKKRMKLLQDIAEKRSCSLFEALATNLDHSMFVNTQAKDFINLILACRATYHEKNITDTLIQILDESGYEEFLRSSGDLDRLDNLSELKQSIYEFETTAGEDYELEDYLNQIALFTNLDTVEKKNTVKMMTIHSAKGLEFPFVFLCGMNEGIFPSSRTKNLDELEEERRLAFVAYTRARIGLFLSESEGYTYDNAFRHPSRFIFNTEKANLDYIVELPEELVVDAKRRIKANEAWINTGARLKIGDVIKHPIFGNGIILDINEDLRSYVISFEKIDTERSISFVAASQLEVINE